MRVKVLAAIAGAGLLSNVAMASGHTDRDRASAANVRVHSPRAAQAGTTWSAPVGSSARTMAPTRTMEAREYRRDRNAPLYADEGFRHDRYGDYPDYGYGDAYGVDDYAMSDRFMRDDDGRLDYDRDYPYDAPYGNYGDGGGYYTIVETTTTTGPSVVTYARNRNVAVHSARRTVKKRRAYRTSSRASASKSCACR